MSVALLSSAFCYAALAQIASSGIHGNYTEWADYIADLPNIKGILGLPPFHLAHDAMGDAGIIILGIAAFAVKGIIDLMGGTIEVNTKKGSGTEFVINLSFFIQTEEDIKKNYEDEKQKNLAKVDFTGKRCQGRLL